MCVLVMKLLTQALVWCCRLVEKLLDDAAVNVNADCRRFDGLEFVSVIGCMTCRGVNVGLVHSGARTVHIAAQNGNVDLVTMLRLAGAELTTPNR